MARRTARDSIASPRRTGRSSMKTALLKAADLTATGLHDLIEKLDPAERGDLTPGLARSSRRVGLRLVAGTDRRPDLVRCRARALSGVRSRLPLALNRRPPVRPGWRAALARHSCTRRNLLASGLPRNQRLDGRCTARQLHSAGGPAPAPGPLLPWGRQTKATPGEWVELRIPHRFRYPVAGNPGSVAAVVEQWCDDVGEPHFLRLCDLEPAQGTNDA